MDICVYFCLFVDSFVQICLTEDLIGLIMLTFKRMIHVGSFVRKISQDVQKGDQGTPISMESLFYKEF